MINFFTGFIFRSAHTLIAFLFTLYLIKFLSIDAIAHYGIILSISLFVPQFIRFGYQLIFEREISHKESNEIKVSLGSYFIISAFIYTLILFFLYFFHISYEIYNLSLILILIFTEHFIQDVIRFLFALNRPKFASFFDILSIIFRVLPFTFFSFIYEDLRSLDYLIMFWIISNIMFILSFLLIKKISLKLSFNLKEHKEIIIKNIYLWPNSLALSLSNEMLKISIYILANTSFAGICYFFLNINNAINAVLSYSIINQKKPKILKLYAENNISKGKEKIIDLIKNTFFINLVLVSIVIFFYDVVIKITSNQINDEYFFVFILFMIMGILTNINLILKINIIAIKREKIDIGINIFYIVISFLIPFFMIFIGLSYAVIWGLLISLSIINLTYYFLFKSN